MRDRLPYRFEDRGEQLIKNIARPVHVYRLIFDKAEMAKEPSLALISSTAPISNQVTVEDLEVIFWKSIEASSDQGEYESYLNRYPNGIFAELATTRIAALDRRPDPPPDRSVELMFWDSIKDSLDARMFEAYLKQFPEGEFRSIAELLMKDRAEKSE